jgi:hypothetical protein
MAGLAAQAQLAAGQKWLFRARRAEGVPVAAETIGRSANRLSASDFRCARDRFRYHVLMIPRHC